MERIYNARSFVDVAPYYDLYTPNNVDAMLDFWDFAVQHHASRNIRDVLEFACGTGRFALPLVKRGFRVVGTDASRPMLEICQRQAQAAKLDIELRQELMEDFADIEAYDAMAAIFTAIGFLVDHQAIRKFVTACHAALRPGGFLLIDVPNGMDGLLKSWAGTSVQVHEGASMVLERFLQNIPDTLRGINRYRDAGIVQTPQGVKCYQEEYTMRIFTLPELQLLFEPVPFRQMTCYCNWEDREPMQPPYSRIILILEK